MKAHMYVTVVTELAHALERWFCHYHINVKMTEALLAATPGGHSEGTKGHGRHYRQADIVSIAGKHRTMVAPRSENCAQPLGS